MLIHRHNNNNKNKFRHWISQQGTCHKIHPTLSRYLLSLFPASSGFSHKNMCWLNFADNSKILLISCHYLIYISADKIVRTCIYNNVYTHLLTRIKGLIYFQRVILKLWHIIWAWSLQAPKVKRKRFVVKLTFHFKILQCKCRTVILSVRFLKSLFVYGFNTYFSNKNF